MALFSVTISELEEYKKSTLCLQHLIVILNLIIERMAATAVNLVLLVLGESSESHLRVLYV